MNHNLDEGESSERYRRHWYQLWLPASRPRPPPASLAEAEMTPLASASFISVLTYTWLTPLMTLGWQRTLQAPDLWRVRAEDEAAPLSHALDEAWARRVERAKTGQGHGKWWFGLGGDNNEPSLAMALNDALGRQFWIGGLYKIAGDVGQLMSPLLVKAIIRFAQERARGGPSAPHMGQGVGLAIGLPLLTVFASISMHQFFWRATTTGVSVRAALIASLYSRGLRFRPGQEQHDLLNHVSTDVSRIEYCAQWFHATWTVPIQISICLVLLCLQIGPAALAGVSLFVLLVPIQQLLLSYQLSVRRRSNKYTDARASLLRELLGSMRIIKLCAYEAQFEERLAEARKKELGCVRGMVFIRATNHAVAYAIPTLAAVLSFITYAATHKNGLDPAIIFPSMGLFQLLRQPLMFLPRALSSVADAKNALERLKIVFLTETVERQVHIDSEMEDALVVSDAEFVWYRLPGSKAENAMEGKGERPKGEESGSGRGKINEGGIDAGRDTTRSVAFKLTGLSVTIPRGSLVGIVGPVGCGKSSLLLGLLGQMPRRRGSVAFGGRVAYCPQIAWIQNATLVTLPGLSHCIYPHSSAHSLYFPSPIVPQSFYFTSTPNNHSF